MILTVEATCSRCKKMVRGTITLSLRNCITDSDGLMVFAEECVCDSCLNETST